MFKRKSEATPPDPKTYGEGLLIEACKKLKLTLIKEHFGDEARYIIKNGDELVWEGSWWDSHWKLDMANGAKWAVYSWAKENRIGVTTEVLAE